MRRSCAICADCVKGVFITFGESRNGFGDAVLPLQVMNSIAKYGAVTAGFLLATGALSAFGLSIAADLFTPATQNETAEVVLAAQDTSGSAEVKRPESALLGAKEAPVSARDDGTDEWVEVARAVNMRSGPSSANEVIKVQVAGTKLRAAARDGKWVQVIEPDAGSSGWVFGTFVKAIPSASRHADAAETVMR